MKNLLAILLFTCSISFAQKIQYTYDVNGNRTMRKLYVECNSCPNPGNQGGRMGAKDTMTQPEVIMPKIGVFPNPAQDRVNVNIAEIKSDDVVEIQLSDEAGRMLSNFKNAPLENELNMANYKAGIYYVRVIINGKNPQVYKVVKIE